jgi:Carboxypeptidase regulatory-like domain
MRLKIRFFTSVVLCGTFALFSPLRSWSQEASAQPPAIAMSSEKPVPLEAPEPQNGSAASPTSGPAAQPFGPAAPTPGSANVADISGTVIDTNGDIVPGATVELDESRAGNRQTQAANDNGFFEFKNLAGDDTYRISVSANGFETWTSEPVMLAPGQFFDVAGIKLKVKNEAVSITVTASQEQIATEQVHIAEQQRVLGFIPNFYVVYDSKGAVPLTNKLKFQMAYKVSVDPVSILGAAALAGINQAGNRPDYQQGWKGYGQRFGAAYADSVTDIFLGGAILPSLLHQDPRYFYQGTGTIKSRTLHALANPFIARGDNGKRQINFSSMGGDLISASISNAYYPESNRGASLVFTTFAINTAERELSSVVQEFVLRKLTPAAKR